MNLPELQTYFINKIVRVFYTEYCTHRTNTVEYFIVSDIIRTDFKFEQSEYCIRGISLSRNKILNFTFRTNLFLEMYKHFQKEVSWVNPTTMIVYTLL